MNWPRGVREAAISVIVALVVLLVLTEFQNWAVLRGLETATLDLRFRVRGPRPPEPQTAVVLIDDKSLERFGRWPLSRSLYAKAVQWLDRTGARAIGFDLLFPEAEQPAELRRAAEAALAASQDPILREALARFAGPDPDTDFAAALRAAGRALLPVTFSFKGPEQDAPALANQVYQKLDQSPVQPFFPLQPHQAVLPIAPLAEAAAGLGHVFIAFDRDGAPRYDYLALPFSGDFVPSLPVRLVAAYRGVPWSEVGLGAGRRRPYRRQFRADRCGDAPRRQLPRPARHDPDLLLRRPDRRTPRAGAVQGPHRADRCLVHRQLRLLSRAVRQYADPRHRAPCQCRRHDPRRRLHPRKPAALAADRNRARCHPGARRRHRRRVSADAAGGACRRGTGRRLGRPGRSSPSRTGYGCRWSCRSSPWRRRSAAPCCSATALSTASGASSRSAFRLLPSARSRQYAGGDPGRLQLGGETRMLSVMFSDIRGFTSISESFKANPQGLSRLINRGFLTPMTRLIMARRGTIDKYMGDCIMAFWNAPLDDAEHAGHACASALAMLAANSTASTTSWRPRRRRRTARRRPSISASASTPANASSATWGPTSASPTPRWATR